MRVAWALLLVACGRVGFGDLAATRTPDGAPPPPLADGGGSSGTNPVACSARMIGSAVFGDVLTGTLGMTGANATGTCGGADAEDVYALDVTANQGIVFSIVGAMTTADTVIYLRATCDDPSSEVACAATKPAEGAASLYIGPQALGTYDLFIDGNTPGTYAVSIDAFASGGGDQCGGCPPNRECIDTTNGPRCLDNGCAIAQAFTGSGAGTFTATASNRTGTSTHAAPCGGNDGGYFAPESIYTLTLSAAVGDLRVTTVGAGTTFDTLVYVEDACDGAVLACNDDASSGDTASDVHTGPLSAGTYFIFIDGYEGATGTAAVTITAS